jgi:hypothetical protein
MRLNQSSGSSDRVRPLVFISYAREDNAPAERLYDALKLRGAVPWIDSRDLVAGENWKRAITLEIRRADYFIALLSSRSVNKRGYVQKELREALAILDEVPEGRE